MANKTTVALTKEQYKEIIETIQQGFCGQKPNDRVATALMLEANLGIRIGDIVSLRLCDIIRDGDPVPIHRELLLPERDRTERSDLPNHGTQCSDDLAAHL